MRFAHALLTLALNRSAEPPQTLQFAGILWGDTPKVVEGKLRSSGFDPAAKDGEDIGFRGRVAGYDGDGWIYFARGKAVKAIFIIRPEPEQVLGVYDRLRTQLSRQYGKPRTQLEAYRAPYAKGDGRETEALRTGFADIGTVWKEPTDTTPIKATDPGIILRAAKDMTVKLSFESVAWHDEMQRRLKTGAP
jgi:hypothetical protein